MNLRLPVGGDENIRRPDVAVHDALLMRGVQSVSGPNRQLQHLFDFQRLALDAMLEGLGLQVLDFGLAKLAGSVGVPPASIEQGGRREAGKMLAPPGLDKPTATIDREHLTIPGAAVGTVAYMSPEQARGDQVDQRTDLFSLGAVLYEMATGRVAFSGNTIAVVFDGLLHHAPISPVLLNPDLPPKLEEIIYKALEKDRELRYQHASDMRTDLKRLKGDTDSGRSSSLSGQVRQVVGAAVSVAGVQSVVVSESAPRRQRRWLVPSAFALLLAIGLGAYTLLTFRGPLPFQNVGVAKATSTGKVKRAAISPDGKYAVYEMQDAGKFSLWIRHVATNSNTPITTPGDEPYGDLRFSPDGN